MVIGCGGDKSPVGHRFRREEAFPYWTMLQLQSGETRLEQGAAVMMLTPAVFLIPPDSPYGLQVLKEIDERWAFFVPRREWEALLHWPNLGGKIMHLNLSGARATATWELLAELYHWTHTHVPTASLFADNTLERLLLIASEQNPLFRGPQVDERIQRVVDFIVAHPASPLTVAGLASHAGLSPSRFANVFRKQMGESPMRFVERQRLGRARDLLLETNLQIQDIARHVGFANPFHFTMRFRAMTGLSPRAFRRQPTAT